jgi:hypothetical protein
MPYVNNDPRVQYLINSIKTTDKGFLVTLEIPNANRAKFEENLETFRHWFNCFCFGKKYKENNQKMTIFGGMETSFYSEKLHCHLVIIDTGTHRNFFEINRFINKIWHRLINKFISQNNCFVDVQKAVNLINSATYALKKTRYLDQDTLIYLT